MILCFAVDGVALDVTRCLKALHGFSMEFWSKSICMGLIGSAGSLLVAKKHKCLAALAISCWWLPASMSLLTMITALIYESTNQLAVLVGAIAALGLCATRCRLIGQVLVTLYLFAIKGRLQDKTA
jgi:hypothetical protein